jgi:hypothetical protein
MQFEAFSFGSLKIDGITYDYDMVIDGGEIRKRRDSAEYVRAIARSFARTLSWTVQSACNVLIFVE